MSATLWVQNEREKVGERYLECAPDCVYWISNSMRNIIWKKKTKKNTKQCACYIHPYYGIDMNERCIHHDSMQFMCCAHESINFCSKLINVCLIQFTTASTAIRQSIYTSLPCMSPMCTDLICIVIACGILKSELNQHFHVVIALRCHCSRQRRPDA